MTSGDKHPPDIHSDLPPALARAQDDLAAYIRERVSPETALAKIMDAAGESADADIPADPMHRACEDAELDRRTARFGRAPRQLRTDPAEATRIDAIAERASSASSRRRGQPGGKPPGSVPATVASAFSTPTGIWTATHGRRNPGR